MVLVLTVVAVLLATMLTGGLSAVAQEARRPAVRLVPKLGRSRRSLLGVLVLVARMGMGVRFLGVRLAAFLRRSWERAPR
jgi:hypothetical protein